MLSGVETIAALVDDHNEQEGTIVHERCCGQIMIFTAWSCVVAA